MGYYDADIADAQELLREFGERCQLEQSVSTEEAGKPWRNGQTVTKVQDVDCAFLDFGGRNERTFFQNTEVQRGDKKILMGCLGLEWQPDLNCTVVRASGQRWKVEAFKDLNPNGQHILYTMLGRQ